MSYIHHRYAGNAGDIFKHAVLAQTLAGLQQDGLPLYYVDTHAGAGRYTLSADQLAQTEYRRGLARVREATSPVLAPYLHVLDALNPGGGVQQYPGSPLLAVRLMGGTGKVVCYEDDAVTFGQLVREFADAANLRCVCADGFSAAREIQTDRNLRRVLLVDPPYVRRDEVGKVLSLLEHVVPAGSIVLLWAPVFTGEQEDVLASHIRRQHDAMRFTWMFPQYLQARLAGASMYIFNMPNNQAGLLSSIAPALEQACQRGVSP